MDFTLVATLVVVLVVALVQLTLTLHVRNTLIDSASEGARHGALAGSTLAEGVDRTRELIGATLSPRYGDDVRATTVVLDGVPLVRVDVTAPLPVLGLIGPSGVVSVSGHAVREWD